MKYGKRILAVLLILIMSWSLCACSQKNDTSNTKADTDSKLPKLKIGVDILKPFFYIDENGDYAGIDAEIATEACRRAGFQPEFVELTWSNRDSYLKRGTVDCIWSAFIKDGREDDYLWTDSYMQSNLRAIVDLKSPDQNVQSLSGHGGMAVRAGSKLEEILLNNSSDFDPIQIYSCGTFTMAQTAFIKGYVGSLGGHEAVLQQIINDYPGSYRFLDGSILTANLGVAFEKNDSTNHCQQINKALNDMKKDGTITNIVKTYTSNSKTKEGTSDAEN